MKIQVVNYKQQKPKPEGIDKDEGAVGTAKFPPKIAHLAKPHSRF